MADRELAQRIVEVLERVRELDEPSLRRMLHEQVQVTTKIVDDPLFGVFCWEPEESAGGRPGLPFYSISFHGVLNAVCGLTDDGRGLIRIRVTKTEGRIQAIYLAPDTD